MIVKTKTSVIILVIVCVILSLYGIQDSVRSDAYQRLSNNIFVKNIGRLILKNETFEQTVDRWSKTQKLVLIQTYMRSGSSLTGDIIQHSHEAFYVYEPLRFIRRALTLNKTLIYLNGSRRAPRVDFIKFGAEVLQNWFTCNIEDIPIGGLIDIFMTKGIKTNKFAKCLHTRNLKRRTDRPVLNICARELKKICEESPVIVIKTIRVTLRDVKYLLDVFSDLKIIHLVRDPRATLFSQAHFGMCNNKIGGWARCTDNLCERQENDILDEELISQKYPDRIMTVQYESIATRPIETSMELYSFIDEDFTAEAESYIYNITMAGKKNNCVICTTRSNSSEHVDAWIKKMNPKFIKIVNTRCRFVLKHFNYDADFVK